MQLEEQSKILVIRAQAGNERALNELFGLWYERVYNVAWRYFGDADTAGDVCQQTFVTVHRKLSTLKDPSKFKFWLYRSATNHCHMEQRKRKSIWNLKEKVTQFRIQPVDRPDQIYHRSERSRLVLDALQKIPEEQRTIIILKEYEELTFREIAELQEISEGTAKSRLYYGLKNLRKYINRNEL